MIASHSYHAIAHSLASCGLFIVQAIAHARPILRGNKVAKCSLKKSAHFGLLFYFVLRRQVVLRFATSFIKTLRFWVSASHFFLAILTSFHFCLCSFSWARMAA